MFHSLLVALKNAVLFFCIMRDTLRSRLASEAIEGTTLSFEGVNYVKSGDCLPACVLSVGDCITDDVLEEDFEDTSGFLVDQTGDALYASSAS